MCVEKVGENKHAILMKHTALVYCLLLYIVRSTFPGCVNFQKRKKKKKKEGG